MIFVFQKLNILVKKQDKIIHNPKDVIQQIGQSDIQREKRILETNKLLMLH